MSFRSFRPSWLVALALLSAASPAAATIHVPADHPTIQAAINAAADGDTIIVSDGTYTENIDFKGKAITLESADGPTTTIIDGGDTSCVVKFVTRETSTAVLRGFTIQHGRASPSCGFEGAGILVANASPTIVRNIISNNHGCVGTGIGVGFGSPIIQDNLITQNGGTTCSGGRGGGISIRGASSAQIIGNTITNNNAGNGGGGGITLAGADATIIRGNLISGNVADTEGGAIDMVSDSTPVISNNIIIQNSASRGGGIAALVPFDSTGPRVINNTLAGNTATSTGSELYLRGFVDLTQIWNNVLFGTSAQAAVVCDTTFSTTPPMLRFNDAFNTTGPAYAGSCANVTGTNGNLSVDPLFVSSTSDFHLDSTSPAIDAGSNTAPNLPSTDFAGNPRIFDGNGDGAATVDMGAYEFSASLALSTSLTFPGQIVGSPGSPQTVTLTNRGAVPITIFQLAVTGDFSQANTCGASVAPGASCNFQVTFTATQAGERTGTLTITDSALGSPHAVALTGTGQDFSLALAPTGLTFPGQLLGSSGSPSSMQTVTLTNTGDVPITISQFTTTGDFSQTNTCGASIVPDATCTFQVTFTATQAGDRAGALTITDNVPGSPHSVALTGTGQDFSIEAVPSGPTSAAIDTGDTAIYKLQLSPAGGFAGTVTLTCSGAPDRADCTVSPARITPNGAAVPFTVSVATSTSTEAAASATLIRAPRVGPIAIVVALALIAVGFLVRVRGARARRRRHSILIPAFAFVLLGSLAFSGCGDSKKPGTPAGTYELTINGTANNRTHTLALPLTVR
jgi:parallel beta-helix repeat protein